MEQNNRFAFNRTLWEFGTKIEDAVRPKLNDLWDCDFKRSENIFETIDFKDPETKIACEVKGRRIASTQYNDTIIPFSKWVDGCKLVEDGWKVYYVFVFTDKTMYVEITGEESWEVKLTGTFGIEHHLIPISQLKEIDSEE